MKKGSAGRRSHMIRNHKELCRLPCSCAHGCMKCVSNDTLLHGASTARPSSRKKAVAMIKRPASAGFSERPKRRRVVPVEHVVLSAATIPQRLGKHLIQVLGAHGAGKGTRFRFLVEAEKRRLGQEQCQPWFCNALSRIFGVLFVPTGLLVFGIESKSSSWTCLDAVPHKATRLAMMHEALDDCRVRMVLWEGAFGLPCGWNAPSAMRKEFGDGIVVPTYVFYYDNVQEYYRRCMGRVMPDIAEKGELLQSQAELAPKAEERPSNGGTMQRANLNAKFQSREAMEKSSGWQNNLKVKRWFARHTDSEAPSSARSCARTSSLLASDGQQCGSAGESEILRVSVDAPKDFLWRDICCPEPMIASAAAASSAPQGSPKQEEQNIPTKDGVASTVGVEDNAFSDGPAAASPNSSVVDADTFEGGRSPTPVGGSVSLSPTPDAAQQAPEDREPETEELSNFEEPTVTALNDNMERSFFDESGSGKQPAELSEKMLHSKDQIDLLVGCWDRSHN